MGKVREVKSKRKGVPIELGGETRHLRFDLNAFAELEDHYGDIEQAMNALEKGSIRALRMILWAGLIHENMDENGNPTLSIKEVGSWIDINDLKSLSGTLGEAMREALPTEEAGQESNQPVPFDQGPNKGSTPQQ